MDARLTTKNGRVVFCINGDGGGLGDMLGGLTDGEGGGLGDMLGGIGDTFSDITGIGAANSEASEVAQMKGENKISASGKKPANSSVFGAASSARERAKEKAGKTSSSSSLRRKPFSICFASARNMGVMSRSPTSRRLSCICPQ